MKNKVLNKLYGKELIDAMEDLLNQFYMLQADDSYVEKVLKDINETVRIGLYLMALEKNYDKLAFVLKRVNERLNIIRKEKFIKAYENKTVDKYLAMLGKADKMSLMHDLGIDGDVRERFKLTKTQRDYYKILSNSIMEDQEYDKRNGMQQFIIYHDEKEDN